MHIHRHRSGSATGADVKVKCANWSCGISTCLSFGVRGRAGMFSDKYAFKMCSYVIQPRSTRYLYCTGEAKERGSQAFMYFPWFVVHWNFDFKFPRSNVTVYEQFHLKQEHSTSVFSPPLKVAIICNCLTNVRMLGLGGARGTAMSRNASPPSRYNHRLLTMASNRS